MELKMNKLKTTICSVLALACISTSPLVAGSSDFAGPYFAIQGNGIGVELDGKYTDADGTITKGAGGKALHWAGLDIGYNIPLGDVFFVAVGASYTPGEGEISKHDDAADAADVKVKAKEFYNYYIMPSFAITDSSAIYIKAGQAEADLDITGDYTGTATSSIDGDVLAIGLRTILPGGLFFQSEAGQVAYDKIKINDIGNADSDGSTKGDVEADPTFMYGSFSIGVKF